MKYRGLFVAAAVLMLGSCAPQGEYRDLAHFRAAYQSSCADYDQAAQLITDGIVETRMPELVKTCLNGELIPAYNRNWVPDWSYWSTFNVHSNDVDYVYCAGSRRIVHDGINLVVRTIQEGLGAAPYTLDLYTSVDGEDWDLMVSRKGKLRGTEGLSVLELQIPYGREVEAKAARFVLHVDGADEGLILHSYNFMLGGEAFYPLEDNDFHSSWVSDTAQDEWVYVDLGGKSSFDKVELAWLNRPESGRILVSDDALKWKKLCELSDEDSYKVSGKGRYVKVEMDATADGNPFILSEMKVMGRNGVALPESDWMVARESEAGDPDAWLPAVVPGTVLWSYINAGAVPDIRYSDNNHAVSQSYFRSNFLYRGTMKTPETISDKVWLNFDGINWKAEVTFNGNALGRIEGAFTNARFNVTDMLDPDVNTVEVKIIRQDHMDIGRGNTRQREMYNGGILGADNPTFHATTGWDWLPALAGREIGIWNDVYFTTTGAVTIEDPYVSSVLNLPDTTRAEVKVEATVVNHGAENASVRVASAIRESEAATGGQEASTLVELAPGESRTVAQTYVVDNPRLWWPNGYGEQNLYDVDITASVDGVEADAKSITTGIRQMTYDTSDGRLTGWVNGRRFVGNGGNWGFSEVNLRFTQHDYDMAVAYHAQQNFTLIRNWVGQTGDEEFYRSCDRYGIMVWQDFWLANPADGPDPYNEQMFMQNADNYVRRIRNHPSIALYCGRNEGNPPASLDNALRSLVGELTDLQYISHSSRVLVSGEGPYWRCPSAEYFNMRGEDRIHSERGMPNVMNYESLIKMIPEDRAWPIGQLWAEHDWTIDGAMHSETFTDAVVKRFGEAPDAKTFTKWAQWVDYDGYRAMFEGRNEQRRGLLLWMSHSCWPSLVWSTYDYWYDPTGAFYGCKKACEPLHIQLNQHTGKVELVNAHAGDRSGLTATVQVLDMYGNALHTDTAEGLDSPEDSTAELCEVVAPTGQPVYYVRLQLRDGDALLSDNFYVLGAETDNFRALDELPAAKVKMAQKVAGGNGSYVISCTLRNESKTPALLLHLIPRAGGERVLPYNADDNYIHLMPGETRTIMVRMAEEDCHGAKPTITLEGFNI